MNILIIEDESPASKRLERLILSIRPSTKIVAKIDSIEDAVEFMKGNKNIDLVFMDIQIADGLSFEIFARTTVSAPVIFTTAFDNYAIKAFKVNSIDYLLKPVEEVELQIAIEKFETLKSQLQSEIIDYGALAKAIITKSESYKKRFLVKNAGRLVFVAVEDISYFFSSNGITFLVTQSNDRFLVESTLEEIQEQVNPEEFFRISRKMILGLNSIRKIESHFNNRLLVETFPTFEEEVIVSRQRSSDFKAWLDK